MVAVPTLTTQATGAPVKAAWANAEVDYAINFALRPPMVKVYRSVDLSVLTSTWTTFAWDLEAFDTDSMHSAASPNLITINTPGIYRTECAARVDHVAAHESRVNLRKNAAGSIVGGSQIGENGDAGVQYNYPSAISIDAFAANDTVEAFVWQDGGSTKTVYGSTGNSFLSVQLIALL